MNFLDYINDQKSRLNSINYQELLWHQIKERNPLPSVTLEEEEMYQNHIPIEFTAFLKNCVTKLRDLKISQIQLDWDQLDKKYLLSLLYFALQQEDVTMDNALYASNIFFLLSTISIANTQFFYQVLYLKIMEILKEFNRSQDMTDTMIIYLLDDFKIYLSKCRLPNGVIIPTVSVLHDFTYCCNDAFENFSFDVSFENLGYIAFVSLQVLTAQLAQQKHKDKKLFPILLSLTSSLKTSATNNISRTVKIAHQKNVRLFIKQNFAKFSSKSFCLVTNMLKYVYLNSEFDDFDAVAQLIQQLPSDPYKDLLSFFSLTLLCKDVELRRNSLNMILPILNHPAEHDTNSKRLVRSEVFINSVVKLCADNDREIRENSLAIISKYSENTVGQHILQIIFENDDYQINRETILLLFYKITDLTWRNKPKNVNYIQLMCNLLLNQPDLITIKTLNRLREVCVAASPNDLKPCLNHLKRLLRCHVDKPNIVLYILSIFIKQMFHPMQTAELFVKELHQFIFSHITLKEEDNFVWNIINYLISSNFDVLAIFERFNSLTLLKNQPLRILMEYKIQEDFSRTSALKLVCVLLHFVNYEECHCLDEKLEQALTLNRLTLSDTDLYLIIYGINKIVEKKQLRECAEAEINNYRQMQFLLNRSFFNQILPISCVKYVILLLSTYARLLNEDKHWDTVVFSQLEENVAPKIKEVCEMKLEYATYISRDIVYISELITIRNMSLNDVIFNHLKKIAAVAEHTQEFSAYLNNHEEIWTLCLILYAKQCFVNSELASECVENLELTLESTQNNFLRLQILYALLDVCNMHFQHYDPLIPHLFNCLHSKNPYMRFIASKIIMQLANEEHFRLVDGQYFLFMGLLADEKEMIARNIESFITEKYVKKQSQTIAKYLVPAIIHYNVYDDHPTIRLLQHDQDLLKKRIYSWTDRSFIYYFLCRLLSPNLKFNILNQISSEIIVRVLNKTIPHSAEANRILEDALAVILYMIPEDKGLAPVKDDRMFYETEIKRIENDLLHRDLGNHEVNIPADQRSTIKNLMTSLIRLIYSEINNNSTLCQNLLFTILSFTKYYFSLVKQLVHEDSSTLKELYGGLRSFYVKMKHQFEYCLLTTHRWNLTTINDREDTEFYLQEFISFSTVSPNFILGISH